MSFVTCVDIWTAICSAAKVRLAWYTMIHHDIPCNYCRGISYIPMNHGIGNWKTICLFSRPGMHISPKRLRALWETTSRTARTTHCVDEWVLCFSWSLVRSGQRSPYGLPTWVRRWGRPERITGEGTVNLFLLAGCPRGARTDWTWKGQNSEAGAAASLATRTYASCADVEDLYISLSFWMEGMLQLFQL